MNLKPINVLRKNLFMITGLTFLFVFSITTMAATNQNGSSSNHTIIVKDHGSKAVIIKQNGAYFFGFSSTRDIVNQKEISPNELIIKYKNNNLFKVQGLDSITKITNKYQAKTHPINEHAGLSIVKLTKPTDYFKTLQELKQNPDIQYAEPNYIAKATMIPNDPYYTQQWGPSAIKANLAWDKVNLSQRANVTIAILDTGINASHEDLQGAIIPGYDFANNDNDPSDGQGHGTHVAGIAAAAINNGKGIAGIAGGAKIMPIKVLGDSGSGSYSTIITGIKYAADHGAKVISMSLGGPGQSQAMQDAVNYAISRGVSVVAAARNDNGTISFPGNCNGVITVGATDNTGNRAYYSNFGPELDVMAPGSQIYSSFKSGPSSYTYMSGTSMATPFVAGAVALVRAANPNLTPDKITNIIDQSATDMGNPGFDNQTGYGLTNASKAIDLALQSSGNQPVPTPIPTPPTPAPNPNPSPQPTPGPAPAPGLNLALHKATNASSVEGVTRTADKAVDGSSTTRWASQSGSDPQWIYVDLNKNYTINKIVLKWEQAYAKSYKIQVSNDAVNWSTVYSTNAGIGGTITLTGSVTGRYVRVYGTQRGTSYGYSLWEFEVYGY